MNQLNLPFLPSSLSGTLSSAGSDQSCQPNLTSVNSDNCFDLKACWNQLSIRFFAGNAELNNYQLKWSSKRQKRTLATCNIKHKRVLVAKELNHPQHWHVLEALLYHEMCHAVLGFSIRNTKGRTAWHGKEFKALEARHPDILKLNQWIKSGEWRKAVRQDRARFPKKSIKKNSYKSAGLSKLFARVRKGLNIGRSEKTAAALLTVRTTYIRLPEGGKAINGSSHKKISKAKGLSRKINKDPCKLILLYIFCRFFGMSHTIYRT